MQAFLITCFENNIEKTIFAKAESKEALFRWAVKESIPILHLEEISLEYLEYYHDRIKYVDVK
jgi:hypothetical protein